MSNLTYIERKKKEFRELLFATNPTEERGVLWRWTKHGLEIIDIFISSTISEVQLKERKGVIGEIKANFPVLVMASEAFSNFLDSLSQKKEEK